MKKSIILDLDGTLWDTSKEIEQVWRSVAQNYDIKVNEDIIKKIMGFTNNEIIEYLFKGNSKKGNEFITECQEKENEYLNENGGHIYKNTIKTIIDLSNKYDLYIVSNCQAVYIEAFLRYYSIEKYFKDYESSGNTGFNKDKNIEILLERNNISESEAVYVGDTMKDYESANKNEILFIWAEYGFGKCDKFYKKIKDICELINIEI